MPTSWNLVRRTLVEALADGRFDDADRVVDQLEVDAHEALAAGAIDRIVSARGRTSRLRRAAADAAPGWPGLQRMRTLDRTLGSAVTGLQLVLRRQQPIPAYGVASRGTTVVPTVRERVLSALDDKPRRPTEVMSRAGVGKRQTYRALRQLVGDGRARLVPAMSDDGRAAFYLRVS